MLHLSDEICPLDSCIRNPCTCWNQFRCPDEDESSFQSPTCGSLTVLKMTGKVNRESVVPVTSGSPQLFFGRKGGGDFPSRIKRVVIPNVLIHSPSSTEKTWRQLPWWVSLPKGIDENSSENWFKFIPYQFSENDSGFTTSISDVFLGFLRSYLSN